MATAASYEALTYGQSALESPALPLDASPQFHFCDGIGRYCGPADTDHVYLTLASRSRFASQRTQ